MFPLRIRGSPGSPPGGWGWSRVPIASSTRRPLFPAGADPAVAGDDEPVAGGDHDCRGQFRVVLPVLVPPGPWGGRGGSGGGIQPVLPHEEVLSDHDQVRLYGAWDGLGEDRVPLYSGLGAGHVEADDLEAVVLCEWKGEDHLVAVLQDC